MFVGKHDLFEWTVPLIIWRIFSHLAFTAQSPAHYHARLTNHHTEKKTTKKLLFWFANIVDERSGLSSYEIIENAVGCWHDRLIDSKAVVWLTPITVRSPAGCHAATGSRSMLPGFRRQGCWDFESSRTGGAATLQEVGKGAKRSCWSCHHQVIWTGFESLTWQGRTNAPLGILMQVRNLWGPDCVLFVCVFFFFFRAVIS